MRYSARQQQLCGLKRGFSASSRAARRADHLSDASSEATRFREGRRLRASVRAPHCVRAQTAVKQRPVSRLSRPYAEWNAAHNEAREMAPEV